MAEWGSMINDGRSMLQISPWMALAPGLAIFVTVMIFNLLGDTLRDFMDPKERAKK
jgi:peptide/nickel transport system permease protein